MLDHAIVAWERRYAASHRLFDYHRWRCAAPGCSSRQSLHDHHIVFRSAGGDDALANRVPLCAFHHLRGVHARLIRISGEAPDRLRFELPLETFVSGDRRYSSHAEVRA
jgi:5-methylcytosine-specific restriction endonuclease McrA